MEWAEFMAVIPEEYLNEGLDILCKTILEVDKG